MQMGLKAQESRHATSQMQRLSSVPVFLTQRWLGMGGACKQMAAWHAPAASLPSCLLAERCRLICDPRSRAAAAATGRRQVGRNKTEGTQHTNNRCRQRTDRQLQCRPRRRLREHIQLPDNGCTQAVRAHLAWPAWHLPCPLPPPPRPPPPLTPLPSPPPLAAGSACACALHCCPCAPAAEHQGWEGLPQKRPR